MSDETPPRDGTESPERQPIFMIPSIVAITAGFIVLVHVIATLVLDQNGQSELLTWLAFIPYRLVAPTEVPGGLFPLIWTPFTHAFLHAGWEHLLLNMAWLVIFGTPVARRYGPPGFLGLFFLSTLAGALFFAAATWGDVRLLVGASGGIAGLMGAAVRFMFQPVEFTRHPETGEVVILGRRLATIPQVFQSSRARTLTIVWLALNVAAPILPRIFGFADLQIAWEAHLGGFLTGFLLVSLFEHQPKPAPQPPE